MEEQYARKKFPIFYDTDRIITKLLHQEVKIFKLGRMPGLLLVDKTGTIRFAYYSDNMHDIPKNEEIFEVLEQIEGKKLIRPSPEKPNKG